MKGLIFSCEHAGNRMPLHLLNRTEALENALQTHRGYDIGALHLARCLAGGLSAPLFYSTFSRLLVDLNRSPGHPALFSGLISDTVITRRQILSRYYLPYRRALEKRIAAAARSGICTVHSSIHSFTPVLNGVVRNADIGFLYDTKRPAEKRLCQHLIGVIRERMPDIRCRRNYPYRGAADGFTTYLRRRCPEHLYMGVEIEINQEMPLKPPAEWHAFSRALSRMMAAGITSFFQITANE